MTDSKTPQPEIPAPSPGDPLGKVRGFVEEHPVAMVAGGIVLGALVAGALSRSAGGAVGGDKATRKGTLARMSLPRRALDVAAVGLELAAAYAAGAAGEKAAGQTEDPASTAAPKSQEPSLSGLAGKALRTIGPMISRRLPGTKDT